MHSTRLQSLDISAVVLLQNSHLSTTNPDLAELMLSPGENADCEDIRSTLESISQLTVIHLNNVVLTSGGQLGSFFNNNTGLKVLALAYIKGITGFEGCQALTSLTTLVLPLSWYDNPGVIELFQLCPNLESLSMPTDRETPTRNFFRP